MKKQILFSVLMLSLPMAMTAQSVDDDLYFVPKKEKVEKTTSTISRTESSVHVSTPTNNVGTFRLEEDEDATRQLRGTTNEAYNFSVGERDVDEYNRRYTPAGQGNDVEEDAEELAGEWINGFEGTQEEYEYAKRLIKYRSPRVAVPLSSPLYWDIVYKWSPLDWNFYTDGYYIYTFPKFGNPIWGDWRYSSGYLDYGWGYDSFHFGFNFGWGDPWPYYHYGYGWGYPWHHYHGWGYPWHHHYDWYGFHQHGPILGGGSHIGGGWKQGFYYDNRTRTASRTANERSARNESQATRNTRNNNMGAATRSGQTATRNNASRGTSTQRGATTSRSNNGQNANRTGRATGRVVSSRNSDTAVRNTTGRENTTGRGFTIGEPAQQRSGSMTRSSQPSTRDNSGQRPSTSSTGGTTRYSRSSSTEGRSTGTYTRTSSTRSSSRTSSQTSGRSPYIGSSSKSSSSSSGSRSYSGSSSSYSGSSSSYSGSSSSYSSGGSSRSSSSGSFSGGGASRSSSSGSFSGGGSRGGGGGGSRGGR